MPASNPSPPSVATGTKAGLLDYLAQTIGGVKTFLSAAIFSAGVQLGLLFNTNGSGASDVVVKVGTSVADASVNAGAKLLSVRTGLNGGTEVEYLWATKGRKTLSAVKGVGTFEWADGASSSTPGMVVRNSSGKAIALVAGTSGAGIDFDITGPLSLFTESRSSIDSGDFAGSVFLVQQWSGDAASVLGFTSRVTSRGIAQPIQIIKMGASQTGAPLRIDDSADVPVAAITASGRIDVKGVNSGTIGADTQNNSRGINTLAIGATSVTITNSLVTATSWVDVTFHADPGGRYWVTRAAGSFTVNVSAAPGANAPFSWEVSTLL